MSVLGPRETRLNEDGTVTILDVPVFAEAVDTRDGSAQVYDLARLEKWLATAEERQDEEGYEAPIRIGHDDPRMPPPRLAGRYALRRIGEVTLDGAERACLFADLTVFPEVFEEIKAGRLPYRSPTIKPDLSEFRSIDLLSGDAPFHKFELLRVREPMGAMAASLTFADGVGYALRGALMPPTATTTGLMAPTTTTTGHVAVSQTAPALLLGKPKTFADPAGPPPGPGAPGAPGAPAAPDAAEEKSERDANAMLGATLAGISAMLKAVAEKLGVMGEKPADKPAADDPTKGVPAAPVEMPAPAMSDKGNPTIAALMGEMAALRNRVDSAEKGKRLDDAEGRMRSHGATPENVLAFRDLAKTSDVAAVAFADALVKAAPRAPIEPPAWTGELDSRLPLQDDPEEVKAFADRGPVVMGMARRIAKNHALLVAGGHAPHSLAETLAANLPKKA